MRQRLNLPSEFLIHAADVEGLCQGIDEELVQSKCLSVLHACRLNQIPELGEWVMIPTTYAGGAKRTVVSSAGYLWLADHG